MTTQRELAEEIAEVLRANYTHQMIPVVALEVANLDVPAVEGLSKRDRVLSALGGKTLRELGEIARAVGVYRNDFALEEAGLLVLEEGNPPITEITRRDIGKCFGDDLAGERSVLELVRKLFAVDGIQWRGPGFVRESLAAQIQQHMIRNPGDWSVEDLFGHIGALACSRDRFARLIEAALHPLCCRGQAQQDLVKQVSSVLARDGYTLAAAGEESGYPLFAVTSLARGVAGTPKNLIFASNGPKPEIGFSDAINNDIVILSNESSCLVYDRPIRRDGLLWSELVEWWRGRATTPTHEPARALGQRLHASLASDAERNLFESYFKLYRRRLGVALPALVPQVYLHYDPAIVKSLRRRAALPRQRMDFLLLLPNHQRVVIEVDGAHHFSRDGVASLSLYAQMVAADRELRLAGYEIYRFGANELVGQGGTKVIEHFFDGLWVLHKLIK